MLRYLLAVIGSLIVSTCYAANVTCTQTGQSAILCDQAQTSQAQTTTVAGLPTCNSGSRGQSYIVTDSLTPIALATVVAGGAVVIRATCDGAAWKVM